MAKLLSHDGVGRYWRGRSGPLRSRTILSILVSIAALLGAGAPAVAHAGVICPPRDLTSELPAAPAGFVSYQVTQFGDDCSVVDGPVLFVPKVFVVAANNDGRIGLVPVLEPSVGSGVTAMGTGTIQTHNEVRDPAGTITAVHTNTTWSWDGTRVTSYNSGGWYAWHREAAGAFGWYPTVVYNVKQSGCAGCASVTIHAHADFRYRGTFDPTGLAFRNVHDNRPTVTKTGGWSCKLDLFSQRFEPWWSWVKWCG